ncbi:MAG: toll/interleukin-1 receptor domain-containing protein [Candidatus Competibacteraceae bacterium]|nr:toll/interleukin-1 receptor domain-containing protein [Candidatus Competibacteraceae bacterium]
MSGARTQIFVSYSHTDADWLQRLQVHLKPLERTGAIAWWDDTQILPGMVWRDEIEKALNAAAIGVLLVSADFLASNFIANHELPPLLAAAQAKGLTILSLIVGPSQFQNTPELSRFQAVNNPAQPLIGLSKAEQETVLLKLADRIRGLAGSTTPAPGTAPTTTTATGSNPLAWLWDNRQWVFFGIGVTILTVLLGWLLNTVMPHPAPKSSPDQPIVKANDGSIAIGGNVSGGTITTNGSHDTPPKNNPPQER